MKSRTCVDCKNKLPLTFEYFRPHGGGKKGFRHYCFDCLKIRRLKSMTQKCKIDGCEKMARSKVRGLCGMHDKRLHLYGDVNYVTPKSVMADNSRKAALKTKKAKPGTYKKFHNRPEHRVVAERKLGRPLRKGEIVHHDDRDRHNNEPFNLIVFKNQSEHILHHLRTDGLKAVSA